MSLRLSGAVSRGHGSWLLTTGLMDSGRGFPSVTLGGGIKEQGRDNAALLILGAGFARGRSVPTVA